ncbi:MAG: hypothetical protein KME45_01700 [Stenomitos rutilans HA7619-LM2]|jgi:hypothetical protein|nr:hypothetical protein [Stenomitos rutilans HA7619-LM2]
MPRLVGKQSHTGENITALITLAAVIGVALEYIGVINVVPGFGRDDRYSPLQSHVTSEHVIARHQH